MDSNDILREEEISMEAAPKSRFFIPLLICLTTYLVFTVYDVFFEMLPAGDAWDLTDMVLMAVIFLIPLIATLLFLARKKAGWIICGLYFFFFAAYGSVYIIGMSITGSDGVNYRNVIITIIAVISACLLLQKSILQQFGIGRGALITVLTISLGFALTAYIGSELS